MTRLPISVLFLLMMVVKSAHANDTLLAEIRFLHQQGDAAWVGQQVELYLELWSNGFSFSEQHFVLPEVRGGYLLQTDASTVKLNESRSGVAWQGLRYTILFFPQRAGTLEVPGFDVTFKARAGFGTKPEDFAFRTEVLSLEAVMPPGAETAGLVVTSALFSMDSSWHPRTPSEGPARLKVGDALTLEITRRARDVPAMVFPPLPVFNVDGLGVYPSAPRIEDRSNRGVLTGSRTDSVTFICEREGRFEIPGLRFQWWDPVRKVLEDQTVPTLLLDVEANPAFTGAAQPAPSANGWRAPGRLIAMFAMFLLAVGLFLYPGRKWAGVIAANLARHRERYEAGEAWAFRQVLKSCRTGSPAITYNAITLWLSRWDHAGGCMNLLRLAEKIDDAALAEEAAVLQTCIASGSTSAWDGRRLARLLTELRKYRFVETRGAEGLPELNPG